MEQYRQDALAEACHRQVSFPASGRGSAKPVKTVENGSPNAMGNNQYAVFAAHTIASVCMTMAGGKEDYKLAT